MRPKESFFIAIEGPDFSGKNTQQDPLCEWLRKRGYDVISTREPGGTPLGEEIRHVVLRTESEMCAKTELFLFMASRAQLVEEVLNPALKAGKIVVTSRYFLSSFAYQGFARGLSVSELVRIAMFATDYLVPDLTILIDLDTVTSLSRCSKKTADRIERKEIAFHKRVRYGFLELAKDSRWKVRVVDGRKPIQELHSDITAILEEALP